VSNTSNFDFCAELGIRTVREIFHLAFKQEDIYPHNIGPIDVNYGGQTVHVRVRVLDDETDPADLSFSGERTVDFSFPFEIEVDAPSSPDPALTHFTMRARVTVPAKLATWTDGDHDVLGLTFEDVTAGDVTVEQLDGLPQIGEEQFRNSVHAKYLAVTHNYTLGTNRLNLYDGSRDTTLQPPWNGTGSSEIAVSDLIDGGDEYLDLVFPIWVHAEQGGYTFESFGTATVYRPVSRDDHTVTVDMTVEPAAPHDTVVALSGYGHDLVEAQLKPYVISSIGAFGPIEEPAPSDATARQLVQERVADYLVTRKFPVYTPVSAQPNEPVRTPVGFVLPAAGVLAVLLNRRTGAADGSNDVAPDNFLGNLQLSLAVGPDKVNEEIAGAIADQFPDLAGGGQEVSPPGGGSATLKQLSVTLENPDDHDVGQDHLWVSGEAEVHIDCWPDPDVSFEGPMFLDATPGTDADGNCTLTIEGRAGDFDIDESCCDVFIDLIIPIVGWIALAIVESTIDSVGGAMIEDIAAHQGRNLAAIPPIVLGVAQVTSCLTGVRISTDGFVFPGTIKVRRIDGSFEDLAADNDQPRPDP
jgi:hypothetical protein